MLHVYMTFNYLFIYLFTYLFCFDKLASYCKYICLRYQDTTILLIKVLKTLFVAKEPWTSVFQKLTIWPYFTM